MSSPGSRVHTFTWSHTHTAHKHTPLFPVKHHHAGLFPSRRGTKTQSVVLKNKPAPYFFPPSFRSSCRPPLSTHCRGSSTGWMCWSSAPHSCSQSVSQSQGQTLQLSSPPVSVAQRCSSAHTHTHTLTHTHTHKYINTHTHSPPFSPSFSPPLIQC